MTEKSTATILREMAEHIERVGFNKGNFYRNKEDSVQPDQPCCTLGALYVVKKYQTIWEDAGWEDADDVAKALGLPRDGIPTWNDQPGVGIKTVTKRLRKAADALEKESNV